jgi:hypothetical protein
MNTELSDEQLKELEGLYQKAVQGQCGSEDGTYAYMLLGNGDCIMWDPEDGADRDFTVTLRNAFPALITTIHTLTRERDEAREELAAIKKVCPDCGGSGGVSYCDDPPLSGPCPSCSPSAMTHYAKQEQARLATLTAELAAAKEREQGSREALDKVFWSAVMAEGEAGYLLGDIKQITQDALSQPPQSPWRPIETAPKDGALIALLVESDTEEWTPTQDAMEYVTIGSNSRDLNDIDEWTFAGWCWCNDHFTEGYGKPIKWAPLPQPPTKGEES